MSVVLTGFSSFGDVTSNPTEALINHILEKEKSQHLSYHLLDAKILPVSAQRVKDYLTNFLYPSLSHNHHSSNIIIVHLGVDEKSTCIKLEKQAVNEATFRIPDVDGWQPHECCIDEDFSFRHALSTDIEVHQLKRALLRRNNHDAWCIEISCDAGRYVCNWTYLLSLIHSSKENKQSFNKRRVHCLFVHVPPFTRISEQQQRLILDDLILHLVRMVTVEKSKGWWIQRMIERMLCC